MKFLKPVFLWSMSLGVALFLSFACEEEDPAPAPAPSPGPGPGGGGDEPWSEVKPPDAAAVAAVKSLKVFFAHKSVGDNILDGIAGNTDISVRKVFQNQLNSVGSSVAFFGHDMVPQNGTPFAKIEAFRNAMRTISESGNKVDIAFMKFCYADFNSGTQINEVFNAYKTAMAALETSFPGVVFVHVSVPLERYNNRPREEFNALLRNAYGDKVFDLAKLESTRSDGSVVQQSGVISMADEWTNDGGHLNAAGQKYVAGSLVSFLAQLLPSAEK